MPKRKASRPVRFGKSSGNPFLESDLSPGSPSKRVSFDLSDGDSGTQTLDSIKTKSCRRKKLLRKIPQQGITLGEISFIIQYDGNITFVGDDIQINLFINDMNVKPELSIEVSSSSQSPAYISVQSLNDFPWQAINDLLSRNYTWVLKDIGGFERKIIDISIVIFPEKTPVIKAKGVVELLTGKTYPNYDTKLTKIIDCTDAFFKEVQAHQKQNVKLSERNVQHDKLKPNLRPYQMRAVQWMLNRENCDGETQDCDWLWNVIEKFTSTCGTPIYYNKYSESMFFGTTEFPPLPRGGILADEMGLGKTVASIALVLNNPRTEGREPVDEELLSPSTSETGQKVRLVKLEHDEGNDPDFDIREKNGEKYMNSHEKLVYDQTSRGPSLKKALLDWYNSKLSEYSATPSKVRKVAPNSIKCLCGVATPKEKEKCVECPDCKMLQHISCVGYKSGFQYFCPFCWTKQKLVKSNATLIISPPSIFEQWHDEIRKHVAEDGFPNGVYMYNSNFIQPSVLASYDVVISTYSRLRSELNHATQGESSRKLRNEERFLKQCSPIAQVQWWRLFLDEAQMVEGDCSQVNRMAKLINAVNRWSVTGTPVQKSVSDLFHLLDCMRIEPFTDKAAWNSLLYLPYINGYKVPLYSAIGQVFWRNSKDDVSEELEIPEQKVRYHLLKFTAVEQNFYMREHTTSSMEFAEGLQRSGLDGTRTIDSLDKGVLSRLLGPLLNLRQACSHPLAVKGNKITTKTGSMTLTELFKYLYNKTKVECEEDLRKYISALNGMAGVFCIMTMWSDAAEYYRKVLQIAEEYKERVHVDSLQRIHTMTNLAEVLQFHGEGIPPTLRDDYLKENAKSLEDKYMEKAMGDLESDKKQMEEIGSKIKALEDKFATHSEVWWVRLIHTLTVDKAIDEVMDKVSTELLQEQGYERRTVEMFLSRISSPRSLEVTLTNWLKTVKENRDRTRKQLRSLCGSSCGELVDLAVDCHLRSTGIIVKKECPLCSCENVLLDYECNLFAVSRKTLKEQYEKVLDGAQTKGSWKAHNAERALRVILSVGRSKVGSEKWILKDGRNHMSLLEAMRKEFKQLRVVWMSLNHQVQARDEVNMCKLRLRLRLPGEPLPPKSSKLNLKQENAVETLYIISHHEVEGQRLKLIGEAEVSKSDFKKKYGTLLYLDNLGKKENAKPEPCPICKSILENEWCVLQCGHSFCIDCIRILLMRNSKPSINCPVCREVTKSSDLSFVDLSGREENSDVKVVGEHSTKVDAIVRTVIELKREDEKVKVLIFSAWPVVLNVLVLALQQNGISFRRMPGHRYQAHLKEFKDPESGVTALILPISWGSKGLNLVEATHVFLMEPIMNPAEELQAVGRVHRIGQTKETVVHRFLMKGTIEEKIHAAVSEAKDKWDKRKVTLDDLKNLFDIKNDLVKTN